MLFPGNTYYAHAFDEVLRQLKDRRRLRISEDADAVAEICRSRHRGVVRDKSLITKIKSARERERMKGREDYGDIS